MKKIALILISLSLITFTITAQTKKGDKVPGYILDNNNKKIEGTIIADDWANNQVQVKFIHKGQSKKTVYKPNQLKGYAFEETYIDETGEKAERWVVYDTKKADRPSRMFGSSTVFMHKEVTVGHYVLYCFYVEVPNNPSKPYEYSFFLEDEDGNFDKIDAENFETKCKEYFGDYKAMVERIGDKDFNLKNMDRMVRDYNYWVDNGHDPEEYRVALKE